MERELQVEFGSGPPLRANLAPPTATSTPDPAIADYPDLAMPDYVEHSDGATEIGKLSAEAIVREYEVAAKDIEALGAQLAEHIKQCETVTRGAFAVTEELKQTARRYREEAKRVFLQIENCSLMTAEVRKTCTELMDKIAVSPTTVKPKPKKR
jgi:hypothetical protein